MNSLFNLVDVVNTFNESSVEEKIGVVVTITADDGEAKIKATDVFGNDLEVEFTDGGTNIDVSLVQEFVHGDHVTKVSGSNWTGKVVGYYMTDLNPEGYCVESETEKGSVQIYPAKALKRVPKVE